MSSRHYRGRFAPSPTGPLHFGSLVTALASYLDARANKGTWLVRMEDLDRPREVAGAADDILRTLEHFGLHWDEAVLYQSQRNPTYQQVLDQLLSNRAVYPCACTRSELLQSAAQGPEGMIYPGVCRQGISPGRKPRAFRVLVTDEAICFQDAIQGQQCQDLAASSGDFVVRRADNLFAYQLAVVVDDHEQRITHVIRGTDLLLSTGRQIHLQRLLGFASPDYAHLPVAVNSAEEKLSKQTYAPAVSCTYQTQALLDALRFLNQPIPDGGEQARPEELLKFAIDHWSLADIPGIHKKPAPLHASRPLE